MNLNYVVVMKHDLDKLLAARFIVLVEEATWFSHYGGKEKMGSFKFA